MPGPLWVVNDWACPVLRPDNEQARVNATKIDILVLDIFIFFRQSEDMTITETTSENIDCTPYYSDYWSTVPMQSIVFKAGTKSNRGQKKVIDESIRV